MSFAAKISRIDHAPAPPPTWTPRSNPIIQARLRVGEPNDRYEQEADRVAAQVMRMPDTATLQRKCSACEDDDRSIIQREGGTNATMPASVPGTIASLRSSGGQPLPTEVRGFFEPRFGVDFSSVRVHANPSGEQAARDLRARAFTVGRDVVFGPGQYQPDTPAGRRLLAHELTHVIQQGATFRAGEGASVQSRVQPMIQRDDDDRPPPSAAENRAGMAELTCDIRTLCQLHFAEPNVVNTERVRRVHARCFPSARLALPDPCLLPNFGLPSFEPGAPIRPTPSGTGSAPSSSGGASLPSTNIRFNLGPAAFDISLPATLAAKLPVPFQGAQRIVFALDASPSGFSFSATINTVPHVRVIARAGVTSTGTGSAGLTVETTRTVCRAVDELAARAALEAAGTRLRDAIIMAVQNPPPIAADASELERTFAPQARLAEVVAAVANVHTQLENVRARCREVPLASVEFGARGPLSAPGPNEPPSRSETFLGVTGTLRW